MLAGATAEAALTAPLRPDSLLEPRVCPARLKSTERRCLEAVKSPGINDDRCPLPVPISRTLEGAPSGKTGGFVSMLVDELFVLLGTGNGPPGAE